MAIRGIGYDAGVRYDKHFHSRPVWRPDDIRRDMLAIRDDLSCNAVMIMATEPERLAEAGEIAAGLGLFIWLQPRLFEGTGRAVDANLARTAVLAEALRETHGRVGLNVGCELTLSSRGMVPGGRFDRRGRFLPYVLWLKPCWDHRLNRLLGRLVTTAREHFDGPLTYGAGDWETVDWSRFDSVGLDTYRDEHNASVYGDQIRQRVARGKPVLIVEFGCCAFQGAAERGASGYEVIEYRRGTSRVPDDVVRDEQVQADSIAASLDVFESTGVHGAFVFGFSEPMLTHAAEHAADLDIGSFGIVKVTRAPETTVAEEWAPKAAFHTVASRYRRLAERTDSGSSR